MNQLSDIDRGWVAGLFEGEGSCVVNRSNRRYLYPRLTMTQLDRSVLDRLQRVTGLGTITGPRTRLSPTFYWNVSRTASVDELVAVLYPLLSERRQAQIRHVYEVCQRDCPCI